MSPLAHTMGRFCPTRCSSNPNYILSARLPGLNIGVNSVSFQAFNFSNQNEHRKSDMARRGRSSPKSREYGRVSGRSSVRVNKVSLQDVVRRRFADMLKRVYGQPGGRVDVQAICDLTGYSPDQVRNWLNERSDAPLKVLYSLGALDRVGFFSLMEMLTGGQSRAEILREICEVRHGLD